MDDGFQPPGEFAAGKQHPVMAGGTFQADIRAQAGDNPIVPAAGMGFA
jgi:hypothetical protein